MAAKAKLPLRQTPGPAQAARAEQRPDRITEAAGRRRLLLRSAGAALGAGLAGTGTAGADPVLRDGDDRLTVACAEFCEVVRERLALFEGPGRIEDDDARDAALQVLGRRLRPLLDHVCRFPAKSPAGHRARAECLILWNEDDLEPDDAEDGMPADRLMAALVRDLVRRL